GLHQGRPREVLRVPERRVLDAPVRRSEVRRQGDRRVDLDRLLVERRRDAQPGDDRPRLRRVRQGSDAGLGRAQRRHKQADRRAARPDRDQGDRLAGPVLGRRAPRLCRLVAPEGRRRQPAGRRVSRTLSDNGAVDFGRPPFLFVMHTVAVASCGAARQHAGGQRERTMRRSRLALSGQLMALAALAWSMPVLAQDAYPAEGDLPAQPEVVRPLTPIPAERLEQMVPKHPDYLGALAPANLAKERPAPPFDVTGTWFVDLSKGFADYMFGPPYPKFGAEG